MNTVMKALTSLILVLVAGGVSAQSSLQNPQLFASANGTYGFKTTPSLSPTVLGMSKGTLFTLAPDATESVVWDAFLLNVPHRAIVSDHGIVVTLDVWARLGRERCLVIYDKQGIVVASFDLEALLSKEELAKLVSQPDGSRNWLAGSKVEFNEPSDRVVIALASGRVFSVTLADGVIDRRGF